MLTVVSSVQAKKTKQRVPTGRIPHAGFGLSGIRPLAFRRSGYVQQGFHSLDFVQ